MSINSMTNSAAARRPDLGVVAAPPTGFSEIAEAAAAMPGAVANGAGAAADSSKTKNDVNSALTVLFGYIPTEVLTLYVSVLGVLHKPSAQPTTAEWIAFCSFLAFTPIVVWLVFAAKLRGANKPSPLSFGAWPVWEMFAATLAYLAWAFALPDSPFSEFSGTWYSAGLSGVAVLVTSTVLGLLAPFFQRPLSTA